MGRMKRFGDDLAEMIFYRRLGNTQILSLYPNFDQEWLLKQIKAIRACPEMWNSGGKVGTPREEAR